MSGRWLLANRDFFVRDLVRDYCTVFRLIADQRRRFERDGTVSYSALRDLLGEAMRKGVFWRLKDTAHHLFRNSAAGEAQAGEEPGIPLWQYAGSALPDGVAVQRPLEALIDWCIGYAFHECAKLKEDAFQGQHYANRLAQISGHACVDGEMYNPLRGLAGQTAESSARELSRIMHVLSHGLRLLVRYLAVEGGNSHLARWLASEESLAREAFGQGYDALLTTLYGGQPERLYLLAAQDFLEAGRLEPALSLLTRAGQRGLLEAAGKDLLRRLECQSPADKGAACAAPESCGPCAGRNEPPCLAATETADA